MSSQSQTNEPHARASTNRPLPYLAILCLAGLAAIWGYNWVVMKEGLRFCDPFVFAALRVALAAAFLLPLLMWSGKPLRPRQIKGTILLGLFSTTLGLGILQTTGFAGLMRGPGTGAAGRTSVLVYTMPFWLLLMAWMFLGRERVRGLQWPAVMRRSRGAGAGAPSLAVGRRTSFSSSWLAARTSAGPPRPCSSR